MFFISNDDHDKFIDEMVDNYSDIKESTEPDILDEISDESSKIKSFSESLLSDDDDIFSFKYDNLFSEAPEDDTPEVGPNDAPADTVAEETNTDGSDNGGDDAANADSGSDDGATDDAGGDDMGGDDLGGGGDGMGTDDGSASAGGDAGMNNGSAAPAPTENSVKLNPYIKIIYMKKLGNLRKVLSNIRYRLIDTTSDEVNSTIKQFILDNIQEINKQINILLTTKINELEGDNLEKIYVAFRAKIKLISNLIEKAVEDKMDHPDTDEENSILSKSKPIKLDKKNLSDIKKDLKEVSKEPEKKEEHPAEQAPDDSASTPAPDTGDMSTDTTDEGNNPSDSDNTDNDEEENNSSDEELDTGSDSM